MRIVVARLLSALIAGAVSLVGCTSADVAQPGLQQLAPDAARRARAVWGSGFTDNEDLPLRVVTDRSAFAQAIGEDTVAVPAAATASEIVINGPEFGRLTPTGQRVVLAHEALHLAVRLDPSIPEDGRRIPTWLSEGLAEHTGWTAAGHRTGAPSPPEAVPELLIARAAGSAPRRVPSNADFTRADASGSATDRAVNYQASHIAVDTLLRDHGRAAVIAVAKDTARGTPADVALQRHTGGGLADLNERYTAALRALRDQL